MSASQPEISQILTRIQANADTLHELALATVVAVEGSAYRRVGARMLILSNGTWVGSISGGCLEGNALRVAREVMRAQVARLITYDTTTDEGARTIGASLGCKGVIQVWIEPVTAATVSHLEVLHCAFSQGAISWWARLIEGECAAIQNGDVCELGALANVLGVAGRPLLQQEAGLQRIEIQGQSLLFAVESLQPTLRLLIFGGGEDARPLAQLAAQMGWRVTVTDDCAAKALPVRFPDAAEVLQLSRETAVAALQPHAFTAAILLSHNYEYDVAILQGLAQYPSAYIGILGPRNRYERMRSECGDTLPDDRNIHSPIGLDIGGQTPFEIALAIVAEVQAVFAGRNAGFLRDRASAIHPRTTIVT